MADLNHCQSTDGPASEARFSYLERIVVYKDAIYLAETGNGCLKDDFSTPPAQQAQKMPPKIRKLSGGKVETALSLFSPEVLERQGVMARFPGGFYRDEKYGTISCVGEEGEIFSVPISVVREGESVFLHGAPAGSKAKLLKDGKSVRPSLLWPSV